MFATVLDYIFTVFYYEIIDEHFTTCNDGTHTVNSYLRFIIPKWKKLVTNMEATPGSPLLLVICGSGLRAANLTRYKYTSVAPHFTLNIDGRVYSRQQIPH